MNDLFKNMVGIDALLELTEKVTNWRLELQTGLSRNVAVSPIFSCRFV